MECEAHDAATAMPMEVAEAAEASGETESNEGHYVTSCSTPGHKPFVRVQSLYIASLVRKSDRPL